MLEKLDLEIEPRVLPRDVRELLRAADEMLQTVVDRRAAGPIPGFVPCDYTMVYAALATVVDSGQLPGSLFCEWGSGLGIVAMMGAMLGLDACGIEIEPDLVGASRRLAEQFDLPVQLVHGTFLPQDCEVDLSELGEASWLEIDGPDAYEELELDPDDFALIFAYPWPGDEGVIDKVFDRAADRGSLLVTYHGAEDMRIQRKR